eukprot:gb/GEZN01002362.1/.p1 GENE.gb/GEZN01002362.1/~~gb/GEZN01002362.1/.p1  ORF type:complete len:803 (+),score=96.15 gb/GEZN01002362.1/:35-2410(+)
MARKTLFGSEQKDLVLVSTAVIVAAGVGLYLRSRPKKLLQEEQALPDPQVYARSITARTLPPMRKHSDEYRPVGGLLVNRDLYNLVKTEMAPGTGISADEFFCKLSDLVGKLAARNKALLRKRDSIQAQIDAFLLLHRGQAWDASAYTTFLTNIGYLLPLATDVKVSTANVDPEISSTPGPQLVVPTDNARYLLNAANARWGSLLDALYGTDAGPPETNGAEKGKGFNPVRGARVFEMAFQFLDTTFPLAQGAKHSDVAAYSVESGPLMFMLQNGTSVGLQDVAQFVGFKKDGARLSNVFVKHHGLHVELVINPKSLVGKSNPSGLSDVLLEAAVTSIADLEDSVSSVDAKDKCNVYSNWTGLIRGTLTSTFQKDGKTMTRRLNKDKVITTPQGTELSLKARSLMLVRNVGMHMYTDAVLIRSTGQPIPEGMLDAMMTAFGALPEVRKGAQGNNSRTGSVYIVKPKLHGPEEVGFTIEIMQAVESALGLPDKTIKIGFMDEERRTTVNLAECLRVARDRVIFINTGFLDRTGDEIHTSMEAGPMLPKAGIKTATWREAYEKWNVDVGLACGLRGIGQIGKGMWAKPDAMKQMLATKADELRAGATTAWVPSPTGATLHAMHYHQVDVMAVQERLRDGGPRASRAELLLPPVATMAQLPRKVVVEEMENNCQGLLGYVVRWIQQGVGCSKVADLQNVGLMEDRATLRINAQLIHNWYLHGIVSKEEVMECLKKMSKVVDEQNKGDKLYQNMAPAYDNLAFQAATRLIFGAADDANGYTEFGLTMFRRAAKSQ